MATLRPAPTRHCHTEQVSGLLTSQCLPGPYLKREGGRELLQQHFAKNCKQATAYTCHEVLLLETLGHPQYGWKEGCRILTNRLHWC